MCGIAALSRLLNSTSIPDARQFMRLATLAIEHRGRDATGFGWALDDGRSWYHKMVGRATQVAWDLECAPLASTVIAHTRAGTKGAKGDPKNAHPVVDDGIMLIHNGVVRNENELYRLISDQHGEQFTPRAEVDTASIAAALAHLDGPFIDILPLIDADAALAWMMTADSNRLHLARLDGRPMTLGWTRRGDMVMSSTPETLEMTSRMANIRIGGFWEVPIGTYIQVEGGVIQNVEEFTPKKRVHTATTVYKGGGAKQITTGAAKNKGELEQPAFPGTVWSGDPEWADERDTWEAIHALADRLPDFPEVTSAPLANLSVVK